jgi:hypothetical protein
LADRRSRPDDRAARPWVCSVARDGIKKVCWIRVTQGLLIQSGLIVQREQRRERRSFPKPGDSSEFCRDTGSIIAFGGRAMDADQTPKYLNSPETAIYSRDAALWLN